LALAIIAIFFIFTQCEKETNSDLKIDQSEQNFKLINEIKQISSQTDQRLAYNLLSPAEKATLWKLKLADILKADTFNLQQRKHIEKLSTYIKSNIFENPNEKNKEVVSFAKNWCIDGLNFFTKEEIAKIAFNINNSNGDKDNSVSDVDSYKSGGDPTPTVNCNCNSESFWSCRSCDTEYSCIQLIDCGWLWNSVCDGRCSLAVK